MKTKEEELIENYSQMIDNGEISVGDALQRMLEKGKSLALKEVGEKIENIDIELMLTDIKDKEGNLYELSEPIMEIISIWWQGKKEELLSSLDNHSQVRSKEPSKNGNGAVKRR